MKSLSPPLPPTGAGPPAGRQVSALLRHCRYSFTERELMEHLQMTYRTVKQREADPSGLTLAEALRVADLLAVPVQTVLAAALADVRGRPADVVGAARQPPVPPGRNDPIFVGISSGQEPGKPVFQSVEGVGSRYAYKNGVTPQR